MKIIVKETDANNKKENIALESALRLSHEQVLPIFLEINKIEIEVLPWDNISDIQKKLKDKKNALRAM